MNVSQLAIVLGLVGVVMFPGALRPANARQTDMSPAATHLSAALATQSAARTTLGVLGDAFTCVDARLVSYRRSTREREITDQWYVASQLWADATLVSTADALRLANTDGVAAVSPQQLDAQSSQCYVDKGFLFLDRLWDYTSAGYYPRSNPVGTTVDTTAARYGDDNSLGGLALLAAAQSTLDPGTRQRYIHAAQREADFLRQSGLWDETFGGGFWWNTGRGDSAEGKPAQTNGLAALFFARLYHVTGNPDDQAWALRTLLWLDTVLYEQSKHLYRWSVAYADIPKRSGSIIAQRYFNYDQGIGIQAQLAAFTVDQDPGHAQRARDIGMATMSTFWSDELGGLNLEAGIQQVYAGFSAWATLGDLALSDLDGDTASLHRAADTAQALATHLRAADGSYALRSYVCVDRIARGCENGETRVVVDRTVDGAALAWTQHLEAALAARSAPPPLPPGRPGPDETGYTAT